MGRGNRIFLENPISNPSPAAKVISRLPLLDYDFKPWIGATAKPGGD